MVALHDPERLIWRQREIIERQRAIIRAQRELLLEANARADAKEDYAVHIVPGPQHITAAMQDLHGQARDGDRIRLGDGSQEFVLRGGKWERLLCVNQIRW